MCSILVWLMFISCRLRKARNVLLLLIFLLVIKEAKMKVMVVMSQRESCLPCSKKGEISMVRYTAYTQATDQVLCAYTVYMQAGRVYVRQD